jgi:hypothetical protein
MSELDAFDELLGELNGRITDLSRPEGVGGRAPTTGLSAHHDPDLEEQSMYVIAYAFCAMSGFLVGLLVGALVL